METMKERRGQDSVDKEFLEIVGNGSPTGSVLEETVCSSRHDFNKRGKMTQSNPSPNSFMQQDEKKASRTQSPRGRSGTLQNVCSTRPRVVADLGKSALMHIARLMNSLAKGLKRMVTKVQ